MSKNDNKSDSIFKEFDEKKVTIQENITEQIKSDNILPEEEHLNTKSEEIVKKGVFEINITLDNVMKTFFCEELVFDEINPTVLKAINCFGKETLREVIFPYKNIVVSEICRKDLPSNIIEIDLSENQINLKHLPVNEWMFRNYNDTKTIFDLKVLETFRKCQPEINKFFAMQNGIEQETPRRTNYSKHREDFNNKMIEF